MDEKHRRLLREARERKQSRDKPVERVARPHTEQKGYNRIYHDHYKALLIFTFGLLFVCLAIIGYTLATTGSIFHKGVSLSGGITITVGTEGSPLGVQATQDMLRSKFPANDIQVREINDFGSQRGITIEATSPSGERKELEAVSSEILTALNIPDVKEKASVEITGPSLGASFLQQTLKAVLIAFICMALVVFIYFGDTTLQKVIVFLLTIVEAYLIWTASGPVSVILAIIIALALCYMYLKHSIPSTAVILAAFSTIVFTIAVLDIFSVRVSTAGIAAFLMLIGYSVDTDILLSTRVLRSKTGTVYERIISTMKTGITMTGTTFIAALISLMFTQSDVIREIMLIVVIGIIADIYNTWIQNAGILRWHLETRGRKSDDS